MKLRDLTLITRRAALISIIGTILAVVGTLYSIRLYQNLRTDIEELLPHTARSGIDLKELTRRLESIDYLAIVVISKDPAAGRRYVDDLAKKLQEIPKNLAARVEYKVKDEIGFFKKRLGLFVDVPDLEKVRDYVRDRIQYDKEMYSPLNIFPVGDRLKKPELDIEALTQKYRKDGAADNFPDGYYATPDGTKHAIQVYLAGKHSDIHNSKALAAEVYKRVDSMNPKAYAPDLEVRYTGGVQSFLEEHGALIADLELSTIVVLVLVTLAMLLYYRDLVATSALVLSLFAGTLWTFGLSFFLVGYLNANSAFLGSIVIGNGINFGIILLARYVEERRRGLAAEEAVAVAMRVTVTATLTAALAAGLSYGSLMLTRFRGFQQFGVIGFVGMVLCWISAYTLLPAYLVIFDRWWPAHRRKEVQQEKENAHISYLIAALVDRGAKPLCLVMVVLTAVALLMIPRISPQIIETDLSKLRNKDTIERGAGFADHYLIDIFQHYLTETVVLAQSREEATKVADQLRARRREAGPETELATIQTMQDFLPGGQAEKIVILKEIQKLLKPSIVKGLDKTDRDRVKDFLTPEAVTPFGEKDLPQLIKEKFTETDGTVGKIVVVEPPLDPKNDIAWKGERLIRFVTEIRNVADSVRQGTPVAGQLPISADMVYSISEDGPKATLFAFVAVVGLVVVLFRELEAVGCTLFSLFLGVVWLGGCLLGFRLKINFLNFIALPITFGIGVDYGVNIFQRYRQEKFVPQGTSRILTTIRESGGAVMLASLTTIIGYSSLLIAGNQAFVSFGRLAVLGEITCVSAAVVFFPAFLLLRERRWKGRAAETQGVDAAPAPTQS